MIILQISLTRGENSEMDKGRRLAEDFSSFYFPLIFNTIYSLDKVYCSGNLIYILLIQKILLIISQNIL